MTLHSCGPCGRIFTNEAPAWLLPPPTRRVKVRITCSEGCGIKGVRCLDGSLQMEENGGGHPEIQVRNLCSSFVLWFNRGVSATTTMEVWLQRTQPKIPRHVTQRRLQIPFTITQQLLQDFPVGCRNLHETSFQQGEASGSGSGAGTGTATGGSIVWLEVMVISRSSDATASPRSFGHITELLHSELFESLDEGSGCSSASGFGSGAGSGSGAAASAAQHELAAAMCHEHEQPETKIACDAEGSSRSQETEERRAQVHSFLYDVVPIERHEDVLGVSWGGIGSWKL